MAVLAKLKELIPSFCGGGGFGYAGFGGEYLGFKAESLAIVQWDSQEGGSHGGILGVGYGTHIIGGEGTRTWSDWKEHRSMIYLPGSHGQLGGMDVDGDFGGVFQFTGGQLVVGGYAGVSGGGAAGRTGGAGGYLSLSWGGCH